MLNFRGLMSLIMVLFIHSSPPTPNQKKPLKATALIAAAFSGDAETLTVLLEAKASLEAATASGVTALQAAVEGGLGCGFHAWTCYTP